MTTRLIKLIATGFGIGNLPIAPGTAGTLLGVLWAAALIFTENSLVFCTGTVAGLVFSAWICGKAEQIFQKKDPACVVADEIFAFPLAMIDLSPTILHFALAFLLFRFFDIVKPPPARRLEKISGGWGVVLDDVVAAAYTALILHIATWLFAV
jgi:phosphatidylglycerophosphatase A